MKYTQEQVDVEIAEFQKVSDSLMELRKKKTADYGNSWSVFGLMGIIYQIMSKSMRIWNLRNSEPENESLRDSFRDIANYAMMGIVLIDRKDTEPKI